MFESESNHGRTINTAYDPNVRQSLAFDYDSFMYKNVETNDKKQPFNKKLQDSVVVNQPKSILRDTQRDYTKKHHSVRLNNTVTVDQVKTQNNPNNNLNHVSSLDTSNISHISQNHDISRNQTKKTVT